MATPPVFAYCSGLYPAVGSSLERIIAISKTENLVVPFVSFSLLASTATENHPLDTSSLMCTKVVVSFDFPRS